MSIPAAAPAPIADTSYRNYDGVLHQHPFRWWIIARLGLRNAFRRWAFWVLAFFCVLPYLRTGFGMYLQDQVGRLPSGLSQVIQKDTYAGYFYDALCGFGGAEFWIYLLALLVGAGAIAADNRANALQIYLARSLTKGDYLFGKWCGVFLAIAFVSLVPALLLYLYGYISFHEEGFFTKEPDLPLRILACTLLPPLLHASVLVGISAWSKRPVLAGALYAALYSGATVVATIVGAILLRRDMDLARTLSSLSPPGVIVGLAKHLYGQESTIFGFMGRARGTTIEKPELWPLLALLAVLVVAGLVLARLRIRAVEVIQG